MYLSISTGTGLNFMRYEYYNGVNLSLLFSKGVGLGIDVLALEGNIVKFLIGFYVGATANFSVSYNNFQSSDD